MQPHLHPGNEKIEKMFSIEGSFIVIQRYWKNIKTITLEKGKLEIECQLIPGTLMYASVPQFMRRWMSLRAIVLEEMASWAPETTAGSNQYLSFLKSSILA